MKMITDKSNLRRFIENFKKDKKKVIKETKAQIKNGAYFKWTIFDVNSPSQGIL